MNNEITTRIVSEGVTADPPRPISGTNPKTPVQKNNKEYSTEELSQRSRQQEEPEKVRALVEEAITHFEKFVKDVQVDLKYEIDDETNDIIIKFFEKGTDNLIKQVPAEAILKLKQRINDLLGIIYDETA